METVGNAKRVLKTANSAAVGFLDVAISCLLIVSLSYLESLLWGFVGALGFALLYFCFSVAAASTGVDNEDESDCPDFADRLDQLGKDIDELPDEEPDPWPIRWFWNVILAIGWAGFSLAVIIIGYSRTFITIVVFAALTPDVRIWAVVGAFASSAALHYVISSLVLEPRAKKLGIEL